MVIFLDFDGVLNGMNFLEEQDRKRREEDNINLVLNEEENLDRFWASQMDQKNIKEFMLAFEKKDVKIVLSTSWRRMKSIEDWNEQFKKIKGWNFEIIGRTPELKTETQTRTLKGYWRTNPRGLEIKTWLERNKYEGKYLIIDDDDDMLPEHKNRFFQTNADVGFTIKDYVEQISNNIDRLDLEIKEIQGMLDKIRKKEEK